MIKRLRELVQNTHVAPGIGGGGKHDFAEQVAVYILRTRKREHHTTGFYFTESREVQVFVATGGIGNGFGVFGECGRIKNHHLIIVGGAAQVFKAIGHDGLVGGGLAKIQDTIFLGHRNRIF